MSNGKQPSTAQAMGVGGTATSNQSVEKEEEE